MTAYKFEIVVLDQESVGIDEVRGLIEDNKYLLSVNIIDSKQKEIEDWDDSHILNQADTSKQLIDIFFNKYAKINKIDDMITIKDKEKIQFCVDRMPLRQEPTSKLNEQVENFCTGLLTELVKDIKISMKDVL